MLITTYKNFSKRKNSTKRPTGGTNIDVKLKRDTSYENPIFLLHNIDYDMNYIKWKNHYYFVDDIILGNNDIYEVHCSQDVLATYKDAIGDYTAFIERSDHDYDPLIPDQAISREQNIVSFTATQESLIDDGLFDSKGTGCYIMRTIGRSASTAAQGSTTFLLSNQGMRDVLSFMFNETGSVWDDVWDSVVKTIFNPFQYVQSVLWVPFTYNKALQLYHGRVDPSGDDQLVDFQKVVLGWWESDFEYSALKVGATGYVGFTIDMELPEFYYAKDDWRRYDSRFTEVKLQLPGIGFIDLDPMDLKLPDDDPYVHVKYEIDTYTGMANVRVTVRGNAFCIYSNTIPFYIPMQISQTDTNLQPITSGIIGAVGTIATSGASTFAEGVATAASASSQAITGAIGTFRGGTQSNGNYGNRRAINGVPYVAIWQRAFGSADIPKSVYGRPLCRNLKISECEGFVKCQNASVPINSLGNDKDAVNAYLNGGFYYE